MLILMNVEINAAMQVSLFLHAAPEGDKKSDLRQSQPVPYPSILRLTMLKGDERY
jgi:hypothetical protein